MNKDKGKAVKGHRGNMSKVGIQNIWSEQGQRGEGVRAHCGGIKYIKCEGQSQR